MLAVAVPLLMALSACNLQNGVQPQTGVQQPLSDSDWPGYRASMQEDGIDYAGALSYGDPARTIDLVDGCYRTAGAVTPGQIAPALTQERLRTCMEMDYLAYKDNQALTNRSLAGNSYFSADAFRLRTDRYGMAAGFTNAEDMYQWLRAGYAIARPYANSGIRNHQGFQMPALHNATGVFGF